jgi:HPr kinase/phosphorylase
MNSLQVHASCVAFGNRGVLIRGKPSSGKSDLVLRLLDAQGYGIQLTALRAQLVADDQVILTRDNTMVYANPPIELAGKLEIRGQGIVELPWAENIPLSLIVDLMPFGEIARMPEPHELVVELLGLRLIRMALDPSVASAPARIRSFLL